MFRILENPNSLWRDFDKTNEELTKSILTTQSRKMALPVNIYLREEGAQIVASVPGISLEDIEISVIENRLFLKGNRKERELAVGTRVHSQEIPSGEFARTVELPFHLDSEKVTAKLTNGILQIQVMKREEDKPKKISISAE